MIIKAFNNDLIKVKFYKIDITLNYLRHQLNKMELKFAIFILFFAVATSKLYQVVSLFRHGARYHINSFYDGNSTR
jgi:hypothetical protein